MIAAPTGATLLDLACGTGAYADALQQQGFDVIGVDASPEMLAVARGKNADVMLVCQRLEELDLYGTAQAAICLTDSINHIADSAKVKRFFKRLALFLEPGAPFIFDVNTLHKHERVLANNTFAYECEEAFCVWQNQWDEQARTTQISLDLFVEEDGVYHRHQEQFCERAYSVEELSAWLKKAGFLVEAVYGELTHEPPGEKEQRVYFVCRRK